MNKTSIKVIKRKDVKVMANVGTRSGREPKQTAPVSEEKIERRSRREIGGTISNWISEALKQSLLLPKNRLIKSNVLYKSLYSLCRQRHLTPNG